MQTLNKREVIDKISTSIPLKLLNQLFDEIEDMLKNYQVGNWKYTQLDGGRFCESASRILYYLDSGYLNTNKSVDNCLKYIENDSVKHKYINRRSSLHCAKIIRSVYKLRSQRGAVHLSAEFTADKIDSKLILDNCKWLLFEILRNENINTETLVRLLNELTTLEHPIIFKIGQKILIQRTNLTTEEEILAFLYFKQNDGATRKELLGNIPKDNSGIRKALVNLTLHAKRQIMEDNDKFIITPNGINRISGILNE